MFCDKIVTVDLLKETAISLGAVLALLAPGGGGHTPTLIMRWNG
jgi:hypothetical protein